MYKNSCKKLEINLGDTQLNLSNDEINTISIEKWYALIKKLCLLMYFEPTKLVGFFVCFNGTIIIQRLGVVTWIGK